jgi:CheY-like chemotaxis protein
MGRDERIPEDERSNLQAINRSGRHLLSLINDVLEISRIEAGRLTLQPCSFDLPDMLAALCESQEPRARDKGLALRMNLSPALPRYIVADAGKLRQVLLNLLSNAVKYTERGEVEFSAEADLSGARALLRFSVRDTGVGIAGADLENIFHPFFQAEYGAALGEGTGLGLTISRNYAQLLGGNLSVESELRRGSTFRFAVPVELAEAAAVAKSQRGRVIGLMAGEPQVRVLVVEDDADGRRLLEELLKQAEFQVRTANDGEQAVQSFLSWHPDFIWMDMRMPVMDGYEATRRIRALTGGGEIKIVALTASAFREDHDEIIAAGCDEVLSKPLDEEQIFATMERQLGVRCRYAEAPAVGSGAAAADLTWLPAPLRQELRQAAQLLDVEAAEKAIDRIREIDGALAADIEELVRAYRYDRIVALCGGPGESGG